MFLGVVAQTRSSGSLLVVASQFLSHCQHTLRTTQVERSGVNKKIGERKSRAWPGAEKRRGRPVDFV